MPFAKYKDFDSFYDALLPAEQPIVLRLRELIQNNFPELRERFGYGVPFYHGHARVCLIYPASVPYSGAKEGVWLGLTRGNLLSNQQGLLQFSASRKIVGSVHFLSEEDIREALILEILEEAVLLDEEMRFLKGSKKNRFP
ncbi:MAG: DUF1801 domain-containing protein [Lewinellaceae bacterium]|nr:DUF1801 domain-containing protein [Lewinellaceae bacterium]